MAKRARDLTVGAFASLALLVLAIGIMAVGGQQGLFSNQVTYRAVFADSQGLIVGSPVHMDGVQVGSVSDIRLPIDPKATGIEVEMKFAPSYRARVRGGSHVSMRFLALLSGEKYVEVSPGDPTLPVLQEGAIIPAAEQSEILQQGEDIAENLSEITASLVDILEPIRNGEGLLGQMIRDPEFGDESMRHLRQSLGNIEAVSIELRKGRGLAGRILSDPVLAAKADTFARAVDDLAEVTAALRRQEGAVGELIREGGAGQQVILELRDTAASLRETSRRLEAGEGLAGKLLNDRAYAEATTRRLDEALDSLAEIVEKVNQGEGTLGLLVNDTRLYDSANEVVGGVNDSKFARWLLRRYRKRGVEAREREVGGPEPPPASEGAGEEPPPGEGAGEGPTPPAPPVPVPPSGRPS